MEITDFTGIFDSEGRFTAFTGYGGLCDALISLSEKSRREGLLSLEDDLDSIDNSLMRLLLQLVVDGTDPELVREIGERKISGTLHYLEEILACAEFALLNRNIPDFEKRFSHYTNSRDADVYRDMISEIKRQVEAVNSAQDISPAQGRYRDIMEAVLSGLDDEHRFMVIENHIDSVLHINGVYNKMILSGILGIQSGANPRVLREILFAHAALVSEQE
jgi:chemotaxis protein MotA